MLLLFVDKKALFSVHQRIHGLVCGSSPYGKPAATELAGTENEKEGTKTKKKVWS